MKVQMINNRYQKSDPRKTKGQPIPYLSKHVPFIFIPGDKEENILIANTKSAKEILVSMAQNDSDSVLLAPWPGEWRQDVFVIDDLEEASRAFLPRELRDIL